MARRGPIGHAAEGAIASPGVLARVLLALAGMGLALCLAATVARADVPDEARHGAELFGDSSYKEAADAFRQATIAAPDDSRWRYDLGLSEALSQDFESALNNLKTTADQAGPKVAGAAHYNAGNVHYAMGDYAAAARSYRDALVKDPKDPDAKRNLELALKQLMQQQQKQNQEQKPDSSSNDKDKNQDQKSQDQKSPDDSDKDKEEQEGDGAQNPDSTQQDRQQNGEPRPDSSVTREQAERILKALADEEARLRDEAKGMKVLPAPGGKDW